MADTDPVDEGSAEIRGCRPVRLSLHLIVKRHLPSEASEWSQERIITELNKIKRVRLDRENIGQIDSMELLSAEVTNLYLQSNRIKTIENLECLPNLQVLVLCRNQLTGVDGISHLQRLVFLDLSENNINSIDADSFPKSIVILNLKDNPCASQADHRENLSSFLPKLKQLNGVDLIDDEIASDEVDSDDNDYGDDRIDDGDDDVLRTQGDGLNELEPPLSLRPNYRQLSTIQSSITDITTEMLMRSQNRLEEVGLQHRRHIQQMTNIKIKTKIRPLPNISKPS